MKTAPLFLLGLCLVACTSPVQKSAAQAGVPSSPVAAPPAATSPSKTIDVSTSANKVEPPAAANSPAPRTDEDKPYVLEPFRVEGEFQMSFGFAVRMLKDPQSSKVMSMYVAGVDADSDAGKKGLDLGDRIMAIDGRPVTDYDATFVSGSALNRIFSKRDPGASVTLEVIPLGAQKTQTLTIFEKHLIRMPLGF